MSSHSNIETAGAEINLWTFQLEWFHWAHLKCISGQKYRHQCRGQLPSPWIICLIYFHTTELYLLLKKQWVNRYLTKERSWWKVYLRAKSSLSLIQLMRVFSPGPPAAIRGTPLNKANNVIHFPCWGQHRLALWSLQQWQSKRRWDFGKNCIYWREKAHSADVHHLGLLLLSGPRTLGAWQKEVVIEPLNWCDFFWPPQFLYYSAFFSMF